MHTRELRYPFTRLSRFSASNTDLRLDSMNPRRGLKRVSLAPEGEGGNEGIREKKKTNTGPGRGRQGLNNYSQSHAAAALRIVGLTPQF